MIKQYLAYLQESRELHLQLAKSMFEADNGNLFPLDLFAVAVFKRSMSLVQGFISAIENENFICAMPLVRLQLDNVLRFSASSLVENPHDLAIQVLDGKAIRNIKSIENERMTDRYLVNKLSEQPDLSWMKKVYEETCGYIHLSDKHFFNAMGVKKEKGEYSRTIQFQISEKDTFISETLKIEVISAMIRITKYLLQILGSWVWTKNNSDIASKAWQEHNKHFFNLT